MRKEYLHQKNIKKNLKRVQRGCLRDMELKTELLKSGYAVHFAYINAFSNFFYPQNVK